MVLNNVKLINKNKPVNIQVAGNRIALITKYGISRTLDFTQLTFDNAFVFPGLINSHDHLEFNLFPQLGNRIYSDYTEWGHDIHLKNNKIISNILKVPKVLRVKLGIYKNLLNGITTVVNHGQPLDVSNSLISVFQNCDSLHSTKFEKMWKWKINRPGRNLPVVIHTGEGTNQESNNEIEQLIRWNILNRRLIGIHGVSMSEKQAESFLALVWCPVSNYFLLNKTAAINKLKKKTKILFGTDSALTAGWNLWKHLRLARESDMASDRELFDMLTRSPAQIWGVTESGIIHENYIADLVVAKERNYKANMDNFYALNPEDLLLVMHHGNIRLFDATLYEQLNEAKFDLESYSKIYINGVCKYLRGNLPELIEQIKTYYPKATFPLFTLHEPTHVVNP